ncbi:MAG: NUDIX domain-containing protein [Candidatus Pacebacteria bacterium]|nr:NUDIX domain-containing protein [Candidatus Paceibacterota bacterium]
MANELIDIYSQNNEPTGLREMKDKAHKVGLWHRGAHIWIYNSKGEILLQLRTKNKKLFPNKWDVAVGGHVSAGEEPLTTAVREIKEELGMGISSEDLKFITTYQKEMIGGKIDNKEFYYAYSLKYDGSVDNLVLQADEVSEVKFVPIVNLEEELKKNSEKFTPHGDYWFFMLEEIKKITKYENSNLRKH